jgi:hypothetical protein
MTIWPEQYRHVAICGYPKSGKTELATILCEEFGGVLIDDGAILRKAVPTLYGINPEDCYTHEGKNRSYRVLARTETVREMLGCLGDYLEGRYGENFIPTRAMAEARRSFPNAPFYVYPSVRKTQAWAYRDAGGVALQIDRPGVGPSGNPFDEWNRDFIDLVIYNGFTLADLRQVARDIPMHLGRSRP